MKCYKCGFRCITKYITMTKIDPNRICISNPLGEWKKIVAVSKHCNMCGWASHPMKIPEPI